MRYRRALLLLEPADELDPITSVIRRIAPRLELLVVVPGPNRDPAALHGRTRGTAATVQIQLLSELDNDAITTLCMAEAIDLLVFGSPTRLSASLAAVQRRRVPVAILWARGESVGAIDHLVCAAFDARGRSALGTFLRDHLDATPRVAVLSPTPLTPDALASFLPSTGIEAAIEFSSPEGPGAQMIPWLIEWARDRPIDLLVLASLPGALLLGFLRTTPVLVVPAFTSLRPAGRRAIDVPDLVDDSGPLRLRIDQFATLGNLSPLADQDLVVVARGEAIATVRSERGMAELPAGLELASLGIYRGSGAPPNPLLAVEQGVAVLRPSGGRWIVIDADSPPEELVALAELARRVDAHVLPVRLRPTKSCRALRERLRAKGLLPVVTDARAILDEGEPLDVSDVMDPVRLARVANKLAAIGFDIAAMIHRGPHQPRGGALVVASNFDLGGDLADLARVIEHGSVTALVADPLIGGNLVEFELDNVRARTWLLEAIDGAQRSLALQVYMAEDDDFARTIELGLAAAGARGVQVRVLVDSLHGLHGSLGSRNALLERLANCPGVELGLVRPITEMPSIRDLKHRDHRKLVIADASVALVGGRNLSREYYTGFEEVALRPSSMWREVPWLDAGARVRGPAVAVLQAAFLDAWRDAGGTPFEVEAAAVCGETSVRVVVHRGLREARTLELYRELFESARSHIHIVNGFPLALELQHVLLRALRRGVKVRTLFGHPAPSHGGEPFAGAWSTARITATELVHSRMDPLIAAGAEGHVFVRRGYPSWAPELGVVHPHVHAKVVSVDGLRSTVGSANLDITASYWESELLLVVEDPLVTADLDRQIELLLAESDRIDPNDSAWQAQARRREWMRHWPGLFSA